MNTSEKLDYLAAIRHKQQIVNAQKQALINSVITQDIQNKLQEIEDEFKPQLASLAADAELVSIEIQAEVLYLGETVRGSSIMAVWKKGRSGSWDTNKLLEYSAKHPEILRYKKPDGEPTVTFREIK